jgi:Dolichyl-phosphate-mannose-protein mannosyltransferase
MRRSLASASLRFAHLSASLVALSQWRQPLAAPAVQAHQYAARRRAMTLNGVGRWLAVPANALIAVIVVTATIRLVLAGMLGLGIDESYMVAAGRQLQLSYFDHPPLAWWLAWAAAHLFHSESEIVVRLPFIALFAVTTLLMYRLGEALFSPRAGLWGAVTLNLSPVFGFTSASWVLPDGPLDCALLGFTLCLVKALPAKDWRWWIGAGLCAGLALLSKYTAVLVFAGIGLYLTTHRGDRHWLRRPEPYVAGVIALALFSPVLIWNANHHWASFVFQGSRAEGFSLHPVAPFTALAGEALFVLPWIWIPLMAALAKALRHGPVGGGEWLLCCAGFIPIATFSVIALWSHQRILFHWAAPGYLLLFPLLGRAVADSLARGDRVTRPWLVASVFVLAGALLLVASEVRWNWLPDVGEHFALGTDPDLAAVDWTSLRKELIQRHLLNAETPAIAAIRWHDAGKLDYALHGAVPVICLGKDPREYGIVHYAGKYRGRNLLIVAPRTTLREIRAGFEPAFASITPLPPLVLLHAGREAMVVPVFLGHDFLRVSPPPLAARRASDRFSGQRDLPIIDFSNHADSNGPAGK